MSKRLTEYDEVRGCYRLNTNIYPGGHIQKLGKLEDIADRIRHYNCNFNIAMTEMNVLHDAVLKLDKEQEEENEQE